VNGEPSKRKHDLIIDKIVDCVEKGTFKPNKKIYSEHRLSNILGINRGPVRETIAALEILGVVSSKQGEGTYLNAFSLENSSKALSLLLLLDEVDIKDISQVRRIMEMAAVELSAVNRSAENLALLKNCLHNMSKLDDPVRLANEDVRFHTLLASFSGNVLLKNLVNIFAVYIGRISVKNWKYFLQHEKSKAQQVIEQHQAILKGIAVKDPSLCRAAMERHISFAEEQFYPR
jgi:GntR family transcriptional repressor for pyruvate dehydrogenase complex